jgi:DNA polymerase type B, organellar and viral
MFQPQHRPKGNPCETCGLHATKHRAPDARAAVSRHDYFARREQGRVRPLYQDRIIGLDGEGIGRAPHRYTFLAAGDERGNAWSVASRDSGMDRLSTASCLDFILSLPDRALIVGFAFLYDFTKILTDLPDKDIYNLLHEEKRARLIKLDDGNQRIAYEPVYFGEYSLNYMNRRITVARWRWHYGKRRAYASRTVWDIFRFYQSSFVQALKDWFSKDGKGLDWFDPKDGPKVERMALMKEKRSEFDKLTSEEIEAYCKEECHFLARLGRKLIDAHNEAGLPLKHYYGAGSTASVFLEKIGAKDLRGDIPREMCEPIACAFFGGRFENSVIGPIYGRTYNYDISSAYPYAATFLPCLLCGTWRHVQRVGESVYDTANLALVRWRCEHSSQDTGRSWGGLPVRASDGTIAFPLAGKGGWVWKDEFLAARRLNPNVEAVELWAYQTNCEHRPFQDVPHYYRERVRLGKDGPGIVLKLGTNSIYGKLAQSRGINPPYQSWVWAGNITSTTRAQLLDALAVHKDPANCLMFATDGVWTRERLSLSKPRDTGTSDLAKPLGGWEEKSFEQGVFCVRPGIYFPINPTREQVKEVRARGLGKKVLYEQWPRIVEAWENNAEKIEVTGLQRFIGAKSSVHYRESDDTHWRSPDYGEWVEHKIQVSFNPFPKRKSIRPDGSLEPWGYFDWESEPYKEAVKSPEALLLQLAEQIAEEQPDGTFAEL